ncbi:hypothetical protein [Streptomyces sp. NPDC020571]|uniref:hypothetical protein n=1 Tax=Streptomyces sp. NPDC020571 TaxID=3365079 RepID=UPI0037AA9B69
MALTADDFDQIGAFLRARLEAARTQVPEDARDAMLALDALEHEIARAASIVGLLRSARVDARSAADAWETLKDIAHRWQGHPDYRATFAYFPHHMTGPTR